MLMLILFLLLFWSGKIFFASRQILWRSHIFQTCKLQVNVAKAGARTGVSSRSKRCRDPNLAFTQFRSLIIFFVVLLRKRALDYLR